MILFSRNDAKKFDEYLIKSIGYTVDLLVEQAGMSIALAVDRFLCSDFNNKNGMEINVFAGKGNNGLDAYACARILSSKNYDVRIWETFNDEESDSNFSVQKKLCVNANIHIENASGYSSAPNQIIVDGIFGVSYNIMRGLSEYYRNVFTKINESREKGSYIFSIDIPSGIDTDTGLMDSEAVNANETVTFIFPKPGIISFPGRKYAGDITVNSLNIPGILTDNYCKMYSNDIRFSMTDIDFARSRILSREADSHKGSFGRVGIFGGSRGMPGAVCLSAMSAVKSGAGVVYMTVPEDIITSCLKVIPEALISSDYGKIFLNPDVLAIGPGLDENDSSAEKAIKNAIETFPKLILDAGALNIISKSISEYLPLFEKREKSGLPYTILTPHPGEMKRLLAGEIKNSRIETAVYAAKNFRSIILYKGAGTIIADPSGKVYINTSGNNALARGGSGDVLTGIIAALYAVNESALSASALGAYIHGLCGDISKDENTEISSSTGDIIKSLPEAYRLILEGNKKTCKITY